MVRESKVEEYKMLMTLLPLARSAFDKKGAAALQKYARDVERMLDASLPWNTAPRRIENLRGKVEPGKVVVLLDGGEVNDPNLYKGANVIRE